MLIEPLLTSLFFSHQLIRPAKQKIQRTSCSQPDLDHGRMLPTLLRLVDISCRRSFASQLRSATDHRAAHQIQKFTSGYENLGKTALMIFSFYRTCQPPYDSRDARSHSPSHPTLPFPLYIHLCSEAPNSSQTSSTTTLHVPTVRRGFTVPFTRLQSGSCRVPLIDNERAWHFERCLRAQRPRAGPFR